MIDFSPSEDQQLIQKTAESFAKEALRPRARECERDRAVPDDLLRSHHQLGVGLLEVPESLGGPGLGALAAALVREALAAGDAGLAIALDGPGAALAALLEFGSAEQRRRLLGPFLDDASGCRRAALAYSEASPSAPVVARRDGDEYVLLGEKRFVVHGGVADLHLVFARLEPGPAEPSSAAAPALFAVEGRPAGLTALPREETLGLETVHLGGLRLDGVRVPAANRLEPPSAVPPSASAARPPGPSAEAFDLAAARMFARLSLAQAARALGLARASYEHALAYAEERKAFGKPVAHFQAIAFMLAEMHMEAEAARWTLWRAAAAWDAITPLDGSSPAPVDQRPRALRQAAVAAAQALQAAEWVTDRGVQILGGAGYVMDHPVEKWMRDAKTLALLGPTREDAHRMIAAFDLGPEVASAQGEPALPVPTSELQPVAT